MPPQSIAGSAQINDSGRGATHAYPHPYPGNAQTARKSPAEIAASRRNVRESAVRSELRTAMALEQIADTLESLRLEIVAQATEKAERDAADRAALERQYRELGRQ